MRQRPVSADGPPSRDRVRAALEDVRARTLALVAPLPEPALVVQHSPLMSPVVWDLGHIAAFEDLWLVRRLGEASTESELEPTFDATRTPRARRGELELPAVAQAMARLEAVRKAALERLAEVDLRSANPLLRDGFVYEMVREHEAQHQETILQTIQLMEGTEYRPPERRPIPPPGEAEFGSMVSVPAGRFEMGAPARGFAYDNERPRHEARTEAFEIGRFPVVNAEWLEFMAAGGYRDDAAWSAAGRRWRAEERAVGPRYWEPADGRPADAGRAARIARADGADGWVRRTALGEEPVRATDPVVHVSYWEAEAFARWRGARLPTETEWEKAAVWDPETGASRTWPWGESPPGPERANLDQLAFGPAPAGACPAGRSAVGCEQLVGDVWEWTCSPFRPYEGFAAFPYEEYSAVFFGSDEYRVLRGGSWATRPAVARCTFRNWDYPIRRQIFAGLRLARGRTDE